MTFLRVAALYFWPWILHALTLLAVGIVFGGEALGVCVWISLWILGPVMLLYPGARVLLCNHPDRATSSGAIREGPGIFALMCIVWWVVITVGTFGYTLGFVILGGLPLLICYWALGTAIAWIANRHYDESILGSRMNSQHEPRS